MVKPVDGHWSRRWDSNPRPARYEGAALPLSYVGGAAPRYRLEGPESTVVRSLLMATLTGERKFSKAWLVLSVILVLFLVAFALDGLIQTLVPSYVGIGGLLRR